MSSSFHGLKGLVRLADLIETAVRISAAVNANRMPPVAVLRRLGIETLPKVVARD